MFTIIYEKSTGNVINITSESNADELRKAIPETSDFIFVELLPECNYLRQYLTVENKQLKAVNKKLTAEQEQEITRLEAQQEIEALKLELKETDYYTLKYMEGALSEEVFKEKCAYRQSLRDRIRELESKIVQPIA